MEIVAPIRSDPRHILWQLVRGAMPGFTDEDSGRTGWVRMSHRGVQFLDRITIPRKQKTYIFDPKWDIRFNTAFEQVVRGCADTARSSIQKRTGRTWISEDLIRGLLRLHRMGYANSYEAWVGDELAGGVWGFQIGSYVSMNSMFHRVSNASKAVFARAQLHLRDRGFTFVDMGAVVGHLVNFGMEWMPQWEFERVLQHMIELNGPRITDDRPAHPAPWDIRMRLLLRRCGQAAWRRMQSVSQRVEEFRRRLSRGPRSIEPARREA